VIFEGGTTKQKQKAERFYANYANGRETKGLSDIEPLISADDR